MESDNINFGFFLLFISFNFCDKVLAFFKFNITNWILDISSPVNNLDVGGIK